MTACDGARENGIAIATREGVAWRSVTPGRETAGSLILAEFGAWNLLACYFPQNAAKARYFAVCADDFSNLGARSNLTDLWRRTHGPDAREWSWRTRAKGFRIDHAFANSAFVRRYAPTCRYDHGPRERAFSDHSAIIVEATGDGDSQPE
jgi:exonuclease III